MFLVTAAWLEWLSHKPETLTKTQAYQGPHHPNLLKQSTPCLVWRPMVPPLTLTSARKYFGEASVEAQVPDFIEKLQVEACWDVN
ncbi:hypothetical protein LEMLEM_LOCUS7746 [Lemmus lemmus]